MVRQELAKCARVDCSRVLTPFDAYCFSIAPSAPSLQLLALCLFLAPCRPPNLEVDHQGCLTLQNLMDTWGQDKGVEHSFAVHSEHSIPWATINISLYLHMQDIAGPIGDKGYGSVGRFRLLPGWLSVNNK